MGTSASSLVAEEWIEYGVGTFIILLRIMTRVKMVGLKGLAVDDFLIIVAWGFYTAMTAVAYIVGMSGDNANMTNLERLALTDEQRTTKILGSKAFVVGWFTYTGLLWSLKTCMLFFMKRITTGLWQAKLIKPGFAIVGTTYIAVLFMLFFTCRPFHHLWQIYPDPGANCTPENDTFYIGVLVLNLMTDVFIVCIPPPVLFKARLSLLRKMGLLILLCAGIFVMLAAILRVVFVFKTPGAAAPAIWACREDLVAIFVNNAPMIVPLFSQKLWKGGYKDNAGSYDMSNSRDLRDGVSGHVRGASARRNHGLDDVGGAKRFYPCKIDTTIDVESDSIEGIVSKGEDVAWRDERFEKRR
ncbi:hypothetical protein FKW77_006711 [Venturia effusa]|uniref:Rhodopsin domain-containing protein n=1 Tax=Venturia effusa TaxID=50376 RepID=A0A517LDY6_9PEZI|nr:hypothetical protein FKW77_006711 [Venturia effusa]